VVWILLGVDNFDVLLHIVLNKLLILKMNSILLFAILYYIQKQKKMKKMSRLYNLVTLTGLRNRRRSSLGPILLNSGFSFEAAS
jgi:hypothetical protein